MTNYDDLQTCYCENCLKLQKENDELKEHVGDLEHTINNLKQQLYFKNLTLVGVGV